MIGPWLLNESVAHYVLRAGKDKKVIRPLHLSLSNCFFFINFHVIGSQPYLINHFMEQPWGTMDMIDRLAFGHCTVNILYESKVLATPTIDVAGSQISKNSLSRFQLTITCLKGLCQ